MSEIETSVTNYLSKVQLGLVTSKDSSELINLLAKTEPVEVDHLQLTCSTIANKHKEFLATLSKPITIQLNISDDWGDEGGFKVFVDSATISCSSVELTLLMDSTEARSEFELEYDCEAKELCELLNVEWGDDFFCGLHQLYYEYANTIRDKHSCTFHPSGLCCT